MYAILAVAGWVWAVLFGGYLFYRMKRCGATPRGFDVSNSHEK
jgi:hypothetical protein